jgi:hypothetical protein
VCLSPVVISMMKCSTLTLAQEVIHGKLFPVSTESLQTLIQNFIIRFQPSAKEETSSTTFHMEGFVSCTSIYSPTTQSTCPQNEGTAILQKVCNCVLVRQGLTFSETFAFILTCTLCCIFCFDITGFYAKQETKCHLLNY